jgi:hypothetical protein
MALTFVNTETGFTFETPWMPEMKCAEYLKEYIVKEMWKSNDGAGDSAALKMHIKTRNCVADGKEKVEGVTAHVHIYSPEATTTTIFSFLNRNKRLGEVTKPGSKLCYNENKLSFGVIEGNIWTGDDDDDNDGVTCCECGKSGSNYATDCLHRFHCKCLDAAMVRIMEAACPKCGKKLVHGEMMRLALSMDEKGEESRLRPASY